MITLERTTLLLAAVFTIYWLVALRLDTQTTLGTQALTGLTTWLFLAVALRFSPREERIQVCTMIVVATCFECLCSLVWGSYTYRLGNLPLFVPPGHGLFYLMALRLAGLSLLRRHPRLIVGSVFVGATALLAHSLLVAPQFDLLGLVTWLIFLPFIARKRFALLYAVSFTMTMALEFYGTSLGIWTWAAIVPPLMLPSANPPACIGAGYCIMDGLTRWVANHVQRLLERGRIPLGADPGRNRGYSRPPGEQAKVTLKAAARVAKHGVIHGLARASNA
jgi:hypothetical protein